MGDIYGFSFLLFLLFFRLMLPHVCEVLAPVLLQPLSAGSSQARSLSGVQTVCPVWLSQRPRLREVK